MKRMVQFNEKTPRKMLLIRLPTSSKQAFRVAAGFALLALTLRVFENQK
ncbi:hypothetical protein ACLESD_00230 [Pyxidicoccus sp. 3LFB2]